MWSSLGKSIGDFVEERFTSPLISSFALAWAAVNYKFFVILFSKESVASSFILIGNMFPDWQSRVLNGFAYPLVIALFYLFVFPYPSQWVYKHWRRNLQKTDNIKQDYENARRLTIDESRELRQRINELELAADQSATVTRGLRTELQAAYAKSSELETQLAKLPSLEAALESAKAEKAAMEQEVKAQAERITKITVDATMARDRTALAEKRLVEMVNQTRIDTVKAFAESVFESGFNDKLTAAQSNRLSTIFKETEVGKKALEDMYKAVVGMLISRKLPGSSTIAFNGPPRPMAADGTGFQREVRSSLRDPKLNDEPTMRRAKPS